MDDEREYLEGLLNARFNYYIVFTSLFIFAVFRTPLDNLERGIVLFIGAFVSALIGLAVHRTKLLVEESLKELKTVTGHPYLSLYQRVSSRSNRYWILKTSANNYIIYVPWLITLLLVALALFSIFSLVSVTTEVQYVSGMTGGYPTYVDIG